MPNLVQLHLDKNSFVGSLPCFYSSSNLGDLDLSYNQFTGSIPTVPTHLYAFMGSHDNNALMYIDLSHNFLAGTIPSVLGRFTNLEIDLKANHFDCELVSLIKKILESICLTILPL